MRARDDVDADRIQSLDAHVAFAPIVVPTWPQPDLLLRVSNSSSEPHCRPGERVDKALAELLNKDEGDDLPAPSPSTSISRAQCETLLSNECIFVVPPEDSAAFRAAWSTFREGADTDDETAGVPHGLVERHGAPEVEQRRRSGPGRYPPRAPAEAEPASSNPHRGK